MSSRSPWLQPDILGFTEGVSLRVSSCGIGEVASQSEHDWREFAPWRVSKMARK